MQKRIKQCLIVIALIVLCIVGIYFGTNLVKQIAFCNRVGITYKQYLLRKSIEDTDKPRYWNYKSVYDTTVIDNNGNEFKDFQSFSIINDETIDNIVKTELNDKDLSKVFHDLTQVTRFLTDDTDGYVDKIEFRLDNSDTMYKLKSIYEEGSGDLYYEDEPMKYAGNFKYNIEYFVDDIDDMLVVKNVINIVIHTEDGYTENCTLTIDFLH